MLEKQQEAAILRWTKMKKQLEIVLPWLTMLKQQQQETALLLVEEAEEVVGDNPLPVDKIEKLAGGSAPLMK